MSNSGFPGSGLELHFGSAASPGITWNAQVTTPADGAGQIAFTQVVNVDLRQTKDDVGSTKQKFTSNGAFILDDALGIQYDGTTAIGDSDTKNHSKNDTPGLPLTADLKKRSADDFHFRLYLMYRPSGADSIWATLRELTWEWSGSATKNTTTGVWSLDAGASSSVNPGSSDSTALPEWNGHFTGLGWINE